MATVSNSPPVASAGPLPEAVFRNRRDLGSAFSKKVFAADIVGVSVGVAVALTTGALAWRSSSLLLAAWTLALIILVPLIAAARGAYTWRMHLDIINRVSIPIVEVSLAWLVVASVWATVSPDRFRPLALFLACATVGFTVFCARAALFKWEGASRRRGESLRPTLIVGAGRVGSIVGRRLMQHPEFGLLPIGHLDDEPMELSAQFRPLPVVGGTAALETMVDRHGIRQVVITFSRTPHEELRSLAERAAALGVSVAVVPRLYEKTGRHLAAGRIGGVPLMHLRIVDPERSFYLRVKDGLDRLVAALVILIGAPVFAAASVGIWITMGRPIFFRQIRVGRNGRHFVMLKFRTMASAASGEVAPQLPADTAPGGVEGGSDRRTAFGRLLRHSSIDEVPQLFNVLKGEMSLIGPRPERPQFVRDFNTSIDNYNRRHRIKGGITGWAQVHGLRGQTSISERVELDNYYIENVSFLLDCKIILLTAATLLRGFIPSPRQAE